MDINSIPDGLKDYLYKLKININNEVISIDLEKELTVDKNNIEGSLAELPMTTGTLGIIYSRLKESIADKKLQLSIRKAVLVDKAIEQGIKAKQLIDDMVGDDEELVKCSQQLNELNCYMGIVYNAIEALKTKSYILLNMYKFDMDENRMN